MSKVLDQVLFVVNCPFRLYLKKIDIGTFDQVTGTFW